MKYRYWNYVLLKDLDSDTRRHIELNKLMGTYRAWLEDKAGAQGVDWDYDMGDRYAVGIHIKDSSVAILFKISFKL